MKWIEKTGFEMTTARIDEFLAIYHDESLGNKRTGKILELKCEAKIKAWKMFRYVMDKQHKEWGSHWE